MSDPKDSQTNTDIPSPRLTPLDLLNRPFSDKTPQKPRYQALNTSTPMSDSIQRAAAGTMSVEIQHEVVGRELKSQTVAASPQFAKDLFKDIQTEGKIRDYLYDGTRWVDVPTAPIAETDIYASLTLVFGSIISTFGLDGTPGPDREPRNSHKVKLAHSEATGTTVKSSPDWMFTGKSPYLVKDLDYTDEPSYWFSIACLDGKLEREMGKISSHIAQMAVYARQVFNYQPNRDFVRSAIVSETTIRLFHFDRSGVKHSAPFNYHEDAVAFVRIILGLASEEAYHVGFDPTIQWIHGEGDTKGTMSTLDTQGNPTTLDIIGLTPTFYRRDLSGRGTTCWDARPLNELLLYYFVKDAWRPWSRLSEHVYLEIAMGLEGVGQMAGYQELARTSEFRGEGALTDPNFVDRIKLRVILQKYGAPIYQYKSPEQALLAIFAAVNGHRNLLEKDILHRDVSINNILFGKEGETRPEWLGVLIDLDMAILLTRTELTKGGVFRTGTRMFQSINVLAGFTDEEPDLLPHDYLDDIESFFYVVCFILFSPPDQTDYPGIPTYMEDWDDCSAKRAASAKMAMLFHLSPSAIKNVHPCWGEHGIQLLRDLHAYICKIYKSKVDARSPASLEALHEDKEKHYDDFLDIIKSTIGKYATDRTEALSRALVEPQSDPILGEAEQKTGPSASLLPRATPLSRFQSAVDASSSKRQSTEALEGQPQIKRRRSTRVMEKMVLAALAPAPPPPPPPPPTTQRMQTRSRTKASVSLGRQSRASIERNRRHRV